jgi:large subunit ribosomal protein L29
MKRSEQIKEFRQMDVAALEAEVNARKEELMKLRFQQAVGNVPSTARLNTLRKEVAQLLTIAGEKRREGLEKKVK